MTESALSLLQPDEICVIVMQDGTKREAAWNAGEWLFCDGKGEGSVHHSMVREWWPASVKF
jgi:hypothetical protein